MKKCFKVLGQFMCNQAHVIDVVRPFNLNFCIVTRSSSTVAMFLNLVLLRRTIFEAFSHATIKYHCMFEINRWVLSTDSNHIFIAVL